jgi:chromosome partitioning protein
VLVPVEPHISNLETLPKVADMLKLAGDTPVVVVLTKVPIQGKEGQDAAAYVRGQGFDVCPLTLYLRAAHRHAGNVGQTAQEYEPKGKAAEESIHVYMYIMQLLTNKCAHHGQAKPALARA